jgi:hypothetical protein
MRVRLPSGASSHDYLDALLQTAMKTPTAIETNQFDIIYRLRGR